MLMTGSVDHGQGHGTTFKQVLSEKLGIDADLIRYRFGDSDLVTMGIGTFGSRSAQLAGSAIVMAADKLIDKGRRIAAHMMEAARDDIVFEGGKFVIAGTDRAVDLSAVAKHSFHAAQLPNEIETGFTERANFGPNGSATFPSGAHLAEVEIDAETGEVKLTRYVAVDDVGTVLNPMLCEGQIHGGLVQGVGQVLMENIAYDPDSGQLLSGSFQAKDMQNPNDVTMSRGGTLIRRRKARRHWAKAPAGSSPWPAPAVGMTMPAAVGSARSRWLSPKPELTSRLALPACQTAPGDRQVSTDLRRRTRTARRLCQPGFCALPDRPLRRMLRQQFQIAPPLLRVILPSAPHILYDSPLERSGFEP
jgi:hypothetical protein